VSRRSLRRVLTIAGAACAIAPACTGRAQGLPAPTPLEPPPSELQFMADPIADGATLSFAAGTAILSEAILSTGEIVPQQPQDKSRLLSIDRPVVDRTPEPAWGTVSNVGLIGAATFAALDPILTGYRVGPEAGIVDAIIYGETIFITWSLTNLAKISFRRPRPSAYESGEITETDDALSFYSGHASITSAIGATATYLAFSRSRNTARPWITLGVSALAATLVGVGRVQSGKHFPTDVLAGTMVGMGVGVLVPHLHRSEGFERRPIWIGMRPVHDGAAAVAGGVF